MHLFEIPKRLAVVFALQIASCVYLVVGVGVLVKFRQMGEQGGYYPISKLALWIKAHGWILLALPVAWYWIHVRRWVKAGADLSFLAQVVISGVSLLFFLVILAIVATADLFRVRHIFG